jgi:uncharacterized membrane protein
MTALIHGAALFVVTGGLLAAALALAVTRKVRLAIAILLDFLTAAGLLRLAGTPDWSRLATAALIIVIRQLASWGLRQV